MNNCVLLVIDSLDYTRFQNSSINLLPFLTAQAKDGIICENIYSQAPYTEAAMMALYCGQNTLNCHGYIERFNNVTDTIFEVFKKNGYTTYYNSFQPQSFASSLRRGVDNIYYNRGFDNIALWEYRLEHYADKFTRNVIEKRDFNQIIRILDDSFLEWIRFLTDLKNNDKSTELLRDLNVNFNIEDCINRVQAEYKKYNTNKNEYIIGIFRKRKDHELFKISYFNQKDYHFSQLTEELYNKDCKKLCKKIRKKNLLTNLSSNKDVYTAICNNFIDFVKSRNIKELSNNMLIVKNALLICGLNSRYGDFCHSYKGQPSFYKHIDHFLRWLNVRDKKNPYFACIHVDDIHYPEMFYSYDTNDNKMLEKELKDAKEMLKRRNLRDPGTITTDLSLKYADKKCEYLIRELKKRDEFSNTTFFVTADHGFSYSGFPIRKKFVNTFYLENFKIPFYVFGENVPIIKNEYLHSSVDIPMTIYDIMGLDISDNSDGHSLLKSNIADNIITIEYCGGGCPDLNDKELMIAAFDKKIMVASKIKYNDNFTLDNIVEIYDLRNDPLQKKNKVNERHLDKYKIYINIIKNRLIEMKRTDINL